MATKNAVITDEQAAMIERLIARGRFQNASEVMRAGLRLIEEQEAAFEELRLGVRAGMDDICAGRLRDGEEAVNAAFEKAKVDARR